MCVCVCVCVYVCVCCVQRLLQDMNEETKGEIADNMWLKKQARQMTVCLLISMVISHYNVQL